MSEDHHARGIPAIARDVRLHIEHDPGEILRCSRPGNLRREPVIGRDANDTVAGEEATDIAEKRRVLPLVAAGKATARNVDGNRRSGEPWACIDVELLAGMGSVGEIQGFHHLGHRLDERHEHGLRALVELGLRAWPHGLDGAANLFGHRRHERVLWARKILRAVPHHEMMFRATLERVQDGVKTGRDHMGESKDRRQIRDVIESWAIWRDSGDWENFRTCWHDGAIMNATWFQGAVDQFIANAKKSFDKGGSYFSVHFLGGTSIELKGNRAVTQTKMMISSRDELDGVDCDVVCTGRFYDFFEKRDGRWAIVERQPIYEKDRFDALDPKQYPAFEPELLQSFPVGYRHLAYIQTKRGLPVKRDMPGLRGPEVEALYARGRAWLA